MVLYAYYRFDDAAAFAAAAAQLSEAQREDVSDLGLLRDEEGEPLEGYHATAAWRDGVEPEAFSDAWQPATDAPVWFADVPREPPPAPLPPAFIHKTTIYRRATDGELATLTAVLASEAVTLRQRLHWQDAAEGLVKIEEVLPLFVGVVGEERALVLLDPTEVIE